ncbi:hypothetical protein QJS10_CPA01g02888 [Acorus calamus]|uniref:Uncharacterized protein n=1 Tax=Acorus calamus TaxID=4465 RepID=A0AAV9FFS3_ACOCL|nr:hypothetical protein QJS10_CPA01g02888 [Acorus calamus]
MPSRQSATMSSRRSPPLISPGFLMNGPRRRNRRSSTSHVRSGGSFMETLDQYTMQLQKIADIILRAMAKNLGIGDPDILNDKFKERSTVCANKLLPTLSTSR